MADTVIKRTPHDVAKERIRAKLWILIRNNKDSLESERVDRLIDELADVYDKPRQDELKEARAALAACRAERDKKTADNLALKREIKRLKFTYEPKDDEDVAEKKRKKPTNYQRKRPEPEPTPTPG